MRLLLLVLSTISQLSLADVIHQPALGGIWQALAFAFLGGMILNLMPCVFPVLFIKILNFVEMAGASPRKAILHSVAYTAGILVCFWSLAGALLALRASG